MLTWHLKTAMASCFLIHQNTDQSDQKKRKKKRNARPIYYFASLLSKFPNKPLSRKKNQLWKFFDKKER